MDSILKIPGYRTEVEIGKGGMATVYAAIQESLGRKVALKIMSRNMIADPSAEKRFLKEVEIVAGFKHPNIVTVHDFGRSGGLYYMIMEYIEGGSLNERIDRGLSVDITINIIRQIAKALAYAHKRGFIHRDVKPANILFREDNTAVLSDFGIAKALGSQTQLTSAGQTIGTPEYMSPEQITGKSLDSRSDLYNLGLVLYEILTRQKPFEGEDAMSIAMAHITAPIPQLPPQFAVFQPLITKLLAKNPNERLASCEQVILTLDELSGRDRYPAELSGTGVKMAQSHSSDTNLRDEKSGNRNMSWIVMSMLMVLSIGALIYYWQYTHRVNPQTQLVIDMLLSQAENHVSASRLMEPRDNNAYQIYRYVLQLDSQNTQAMEGLTTIADQYESRAIEAQQQARIEQALAQIELGLKSDPQHSGLLKLHEKLVQQQNIEQILAKAKQQLIAVHLTQPTGDNAYESFRSVLALDPSSKEALDGLREIADQLEKQAFLKQRQNQPEQALELIGQGLQIVPQHRGLLTLGRWIDEQQARRLKQQKLAQLIFQAERQLKASQLTSPPEDNALASFRKALQLDPKNVAARVGLDRIARRYEQIARQHQAEGAFEKGLSAAGLGLEVSPGYEDLQALRSELEGQLEARAHQQTEQTNHQRELQRLLVLAEQQLAASQLTEPQDDNARATFQAILALDPRNASAQAGLQDIAAKYEKKALRAKTEGRMEDSLKAATAGLQAVSDHAKLLALKEQITRQLNEHTRQDRQLSELLAAARQKQHAGDYEQSLFLIEEGLKVNPRHVDLAVFREELIVQLDEQRQQRQLDELIMKAEKQFSVFRLTRPAGDNAYESYSRVLQISPGEQRALAGLRRIADRYLAMGQTKLDQGTAKQGLEMIERGLEVISDHPGLLALRNDALQELETQKSQRQEIAALLSKAHQQFQAKRLTQPQEDNAYETYKTILQLDPANREAKEGLQKIAQHYETLARKSHSAGTLEEGLILVRQGLMMDANHAGLLDLQQALQRAVEKQKDINNRIASLLDAAQQRVKANRFTKPKGDNALELYQEVLRIDPKNSKALDGMAIIAENYQARARAKQNQGDPQQGLIIVEEGLAIIPMDAGLLSMRGTLVQQIKAVDTDTTSASNSNAGTACSDGSEEHVFSEGAMIGCAGSVAWKDRNSLCSVGWTACSADQWVDLRNGLVPTHNYWTSDKLLYYGTPDSCMASVSYGNSCNSGTPMRVCAGVSDPEGNRCNWFNCGYDQFSPNEYFGGCNGNNYAGTLCCAPG